MVGIAHPTTDAAEIDWVVKPLHEQAIEHLKDYVVNTIRIWKNSSIGTQYTSDQCNEMNARRSTMILQNKVVLVTGNFRNWSCNRVSEA
jgi:chorismate-pyruvate lyase